MEERLKILPPSGSHEEVKEKHSSKPKNGEFDPLATKAKFDRLWLNDREQFDPERNAFERLRVKRTWELLAQHIDLKNAIVVDLGCGNGLFAREVFAQGGSVDAVDVSTNALKELSDINDSKFRKIQGCIPKTTLPDDHYDLVISTELIGYLPAQEHRLYFSELSRVIKSKGLVLCSTSLDIDTDGALERFSTLAETEFQIITWSVSYHTLLLRVVKFFKAPARYAKASKLPDVRKHELKQKRPWGQKWFRFNTSPFIGKIWGIIQIATTPIGHFIENQKSLVLMMEQICRFFSAENGISHAMFVGRRHPILQPTELEMMANERKGKKQVWE